MKALIIGGSDAGISAALRIRELNPSIFPTVVLADEYPNYSICGLPFYLSGETPDWKSLAHRTEFEGITLLKHHTAIGIQTKDKVVEVLDSKEEKQALKYDCLLVATGARPVRPSIDGLALPGVFQLHTMEDSFRVHRYLDDTSPRSAVIIGAGYIGVEMADALRHRGIAVTLVSRPNAVFPTVDKEFGVLIDEELKAHGVEVLTGVEVEGIEKFEDGLEVCGSGGFTKKTQLVLFAVGVHPNGELARSAGIKTGERGAICVDRQMRTNIKSIFAAGDCVETWHRILRRNTYMPLGTIAHKQGRVASENMLGGNRGFEGVVGTQVVKIFSLVAARTGLKEAEAKEAGYEPVTVQSEVWDHKAYYPGAQRMHLRVTGDRSTGVLLGAQILGSFQSEVSKRIDVFATALFHGMTVEALNDLDLSYTPPVSSPWDAIQVAAQSWASSLRARTVDKSKEEA